MKLDLAIELALSLIEQASRISLLVKNAKLQGRTELNPMEWSSVLGENDAAMANLRDAILTARL